MLVVDASVLVVALADDGTDGDTARARLRGEDLTAPELVDLEVASGLRRHTKNGQIDVARADLAHHADEGSPEYDSSPELPGQGPGTREKQPISPRPLGVEAAIQEDRSGARRACPWRSPPW